MGEGRREGADADGAEGHSLLVGVGARETRNEEERGTVEE